MTVIATTMPSPHLAPLLLNPKTGEPYLRLPAPNSNIILTPPRVSDAEAIVPILNDERVFKWLESPPYPYLQEHAESWIEQTSKAAEGVLRELEENPGTILVGECPVRILREINGDEEIFLGDCGVHRALWPEIGEGEEKKRLRKENNARPNGDGEIMWAIGDYLAPSHHGKGIMTAALGTLLHQWMIPRMGVKKITSTAFQGNIGSLRVFQKNGFVLEETLERWTKISESKGGGRVGLHVLRWQLEGED